MEVFLNKNANDETNVNNETFNEYFKYHNLSFIVKRFITPIKLEMRKQ